MRIFTSKRFDREFDRLIERLQRTAEQKLALFAANPWHPSLRLKRLASERGLWEISVTMSCRITLEWTGEDVTLRRVGTHSVLEQP
jgi:mRNA-degrading endonuclease YafQ of YafQ-DinJ toxin-antitoxin module